MSEQLRDFVRESNRIEGIEREPVDDEIAAHSVFLSQKCIELVHLCGFVATVAFAELRDRPGMNVVVGAHRPLAGGPKVTQALTDLLYGIRDGIPGLTPYRAHLRYEQLHPFMDGNGRSGRILWAWMMQHRGQDPFSLPFLHRFYYQTLDASR